MCEEVLTMDWDVPAQREIDEKVGGAPKGQIEVLQLSHSVLNPKLLEPFTGLTKLVMYPDNEIVRCQSLDCLPPLPCLEYLEMPDHCVAEVPSDFAARFPKLRILSLGANKICAASALAPLQGCKELRRVVIVDNPVCDTPDYRKAVFEVVPQLVKVDGVDKEGRGSADDLSDSDVDDQDDEEEEEEEDEDEVAANKDDAPPRTLPQTPASVQGTKRGQEDATDEPEAKRPRAP
eukprot:TRINITY_DN3408_c0_g1_i2.p1 TRINITY_DN3408_c0_g1~~TRINITY_DN3408_c0_g1_i2.p1  ORF type:complete len:234 (+),score=80.65 TRINITY_DN3408_c0_g1_i2:74-775(+)